MPRKTRPHQPGPDGHATRSTRNEIDELSPESLFDTTDTPEPDDDEDTIREVVRGRVRVTMWEAF